MGRSWQVELSYYEKRQTTDELQCEKCLEKLIDKQTNWAKPIIIRNYEYSFATGCLAIQ